MFISVQFSSVQSLSHIQLFATPWTVACQASLSITRSQSLLKLISIELVMPSNHLIPCCPLLLPPQSFPASGSFPMSQLFASGGQSIGVSNSTSVLPMNTRDWSPLGWTGWISLQSTPTSTPCVCAKSLQSCLTLLVPETVVHQTPLSIGFSRQEYWNGLPCPPSEDLPDPGIEPQTLMSPAFAGGFFITSTTWEGICCSSKNLRRRQ